MPQSPILGPRTGRERSTTQPSVAAKGAVGNGGRRPAESAVTTNYVSTFILTSPESTASAGTEPRKAGSIAALQLELLRAGPSRFTSDDLLFEVHVCRRGIEAGQIGSAQV